jgi:NAD(P)-dependent dehydrogenase (short-subunit alcohol dehydrogenase family)
MSLRDRVAVVTGGTQGIGLCVARRLAVDEATVVPVASCDMAKSEAVVAELTAAGGKALPAVADVRSKAAVDKLAARVQTELGRLDILVNSAGVFYPTPAGVSSEADIDRMVDINLKGAFVAINACVPEMKARRFGKIVSIASVAAVMGLPMYSLYCATKAGVSLMTRALACELAPFGINVNAIAPGNTATSMNESIRTDPKFRSLLETMSARTPSGRTYSTPEEMADLVAYLVSDRARAMHGTTVLIDEGFSAGL